MKTTFFFIDFSKKINNETKQAKKNWIVMNESWLNTSSIICISICRQRAIICMLTNSYFLVLEIFFFSFFFINSNKKMLTMVYSFWHDQFAKADKSEHLLEKYLSMHKMIHHYVKSAFINREKQKRKSNYYRDFFSGL